ncbi:hypothetical protein K0504_09380 [Neiella marina]|uniref:Flagellar basal-body/hook protein C-terminal domain-containing protein n=1 Tax=Neiella holothuriorum TaxID=2870530 RepID=A0ABS7EFX1_9GAMM|nr:hypothetical protein [Neiella holothuriorum]MBW8191247.1 hypothetical protein [Neiella holothuriorum]
MNSIHQSGINLVNQAFYTASQSAQEIAEVVVEPETSELSSSNLIGPVVELKKAEILSLAGTKVIQTADDMVGTLIDTKV